MNIKVPVKMIQALNKTPRNCGVFLYLLITNLILYQPDQTDF